MNSHQRKKITELILKREQLRSQSRLKRLVVDPIRTVPFYVIALLGRVGPFQLTFPTMWGGRMTSYLPEGNTFLYYGYCEANLTNFFLRYIKPGMVCIDIGAHVGFYTMLFSQLVGEDGRVHSFEPTTWTFALLERNTASLSNVTLQKKAIASQSATLTLADYGPGYGAYNSAHEAGAAGMRRRKKTSEMVEAVSVDHYCNYASVHPDVIKIDAEGYEPEVLLGMAVLLRQKNRPIITLEVAGGDAWAKSRGQAFSVLERNDYVLFEIAVNGMLKRHTPRSDYEYDNLVAIPRERLGETEECVGE